MLQTHTRQKKFYRTLIVMYYYNSFSHILTSEKYGIVV